MAYGFGHNFSVPLAPRFLFPSCTSDPSVHPIPPTAGTGHLYSPDLEAPLAHLDPCDLFVSLHHACFSSAFPVVVNSPFHPGRLTRHLGMMDTGHHEDTSHLPSSVAPVTFSLSAVLSALSLTPLISFSAHIQALSFVTGAGRTGWTDISAVSVSLPICLSHSGHRAL